MKAKIVPIVVIAIAALGACGSSGPSADDAYPHGGASYTETIRGNSSMALRDLTILPDWMTRDPAKAPTLIEGSFHDIRADHAWKNMPEGQIRNGVDISVVPWETAEADFRTILADFTIVDVIEAGNLDDKPLLRTTLKPGAVLTLTLSLYNSTSMDSAAKTLTEYGDVIIPVVQLNYPLPDSEASRLRLAAGNDMIFDVTETGLLSLPLAEPGFGKLFLGGLSTKQQLVDLAESAR